MGGRTDRNTLAHTAHTDLTVMIEMSQTPKSMVVDTLLFDAKHQQANRPATAEQDGNKTTLMELNN